MKRALLIAIVILLRIAAAHAQTTTFVPNCGGDDDTARFVSLIAKIGTNTGTIRLPYKADTRCAVGNLTIPDNITLDNSDGTGIKSNGGATLLVLGPVVNPVGRQMFFGPGAISFAGNTHIGTGGQALISGGDGTTSWANVGGGGGGPTTGSGAAVLQTGPTIIGASLTGNTTATSINKVAITAPANGATLTIADGKTFTVNNSLILTGTDGAQLLLGQPLVTGGSGQITLTGGGTLNFNGFTGTIPATGTVAMGADTVSVSSTNNSSTSLHSHAVTSSSNPGPAASLLATNASGILQLEKLGIGTAPSQSLEVAGNVFVKTATANLFLKDLSTGWQASNTTVINPLPNNSVCSNNFTSGLIGWCVNAVGNAEFANVDVRGALHTSVLVYNALQATAGTLGVFKSAAKLRTDATVPGGPTYGTTTINIDVVDADGLTHAASQLFANNDILRLKEGLTGDTWFKVASVSDQGSFWRYTATIMAGSSNVTYRAGLGVADYGAAGQGFIIQTADQTNAPYLQMATHPATFTSLDSAGTLNVTPRLRIGNLNGSYGYVADTYGFAAGERAAGQSWISVDTVNGVRIGNNTTVLAQADAAGNAFFTGSVTAGSGAIGGWSITSTELKSGSGGNTVGLSSAVTGADDVRFYAGSATPTAAPFRVTESGALVATNANITGAVTATSGSFTGSITASSGSIAGWTINSTSLTNSATTIASNADFAGSGVAAWFGRGSSGYGGYMLRDASGRKVQSLVSDGTTFPYVGTFDGTRWRTVIGGLNFAFGSDGSTNSMGMKIWAADGTKLVEFSDVQNKIGGWTVGASALGAGSGSTTVGLDSGGVNPAIFAGSSTAASAPFRVTNTGALFASNATITGSVTATSGSFTGTVTASSGSIGGWTVNSSQISSTGIELNSGGSANILAGGGNVKLDAGGISLTPANNSLNQVKWTGDPDIADASLSAYDNGGPIIMDQRVIAAGSTNDARMLLLASSQSGGTGMSLGIFAKPADSASWAHFNGTLFKGVGIGLALNAPQPAPVAMLETYTSAASDTILDGLAVSRWRTTGSPAAGTGAAVLYRLETTAFSMRDAARVAAIWTTATDASRTSAVVIQTVNSGGSLSEIFRFAPGGMQIWDGAAMQPITFGAADSCGTGFRCVRIPN